MITYSDVATGILQNMRLGLLSVWASKRDRRTHADLGDVTVNVIPQIVNLLAAQAKSRFGTGGRVGGVDSGNQGKTVWRGLNPHTVQRPRWCCG
ncbi:hypothetical protein [Roseivivax isoporae]|uniref:hypothetical protein n=1 Tax=Roseivivax isoporae TaxID=591206 RepID=UPI0012EC9B70|nr:hypothetical protein [Roseivivax isoporae]